jgi:hypothetical protein
LILPFKKGIMEASPRIGSFPSIALLLVPKEVRMEMVKTLMKIMSLVISLMQIMTSVNKTTAMVYLIRLYLQKTTTFLALCMVKKTQNPLLQSFR